MATLVLILLKQTSEKDTAPMDGHCLRRRISSWPVKHSKAGDGDGHSSSSSNSSSSCDGGGRDEGERLEAILNEDRKNKLFVFNQRTSS